jgi:hypothetical protein
MSDAAWEKFFRDTAHFESVCGGALGGCPDDVHIFRVRWENA